MGWTTPRSASTPWIGAKAASETADASGAVLPGSGDPVRVPPGSRVLIRGLPGSRLRCDPHPATIITVIIGRPSTIRTPRPSCGCPA